MRGIILALLLALAGSEKSQNEHLLNPSKTYVYNYEGITLSGMPDKGLSEAGLKVNLGAEISGFAQRTFMLKVQQVDIKEYNGQWPRDPFTRSTKLNQAIAEQIKHPFKFEYHDGRIGDVFAAEGVSSTVVNMIQGLLYLLQAQIRKSQNVYDLEEDCISGKCPNRYIIQEEDKKSNTIIVIKSRDLGKCENRAVKRFGMNVLEPCRECQQKSQNLRGMFTCTYRIKNKAEGAVIEEVKAKEVFQYSPFHELYGAAVTEVRQVLTLKEIKSSRVSEPHVQLEIHGGLKFRFGSEVYQMPLHLFKAKKIEAQVSDTLQHLAQNSQQEVQTEASAKFLQLIELLRDLNTENIKAILKQYSDKPMYWQWLAKAIPLIGTAESLKVVKRNIPNQSTQEAAMSITLALQHTQASQNALQIAAVEEIQLSILMNHSTHTEVRMMADAVLIGCKPSAATVITMAQAIQKETKVNLHLASFVYSYIKALTKDAAPENRELKEACNVAIKIMNSVPDKLSMRYSKALNLDMFNDPLMDGATDNVFIMNSPTTTLPNVIIFKLRGYMAGASTELKARLSTSLYRMKATKKSSGNRTFPLTRILCRKNMVKIVKTLTGFKRLPSEVTLISSYLKVFLQET